MQDGRASNTTELGGASSLGMRAFPLGFRDPAVEAAYRAKWQRATRQDHIIWTCGAVVGYAFLSALLWIAAEPGFLEFQWFRLFVALPLLLAACVCVVWRPVADRVYFPLFVLKTLAIYGNAVVSYALADAPDIRMYLFESCLIFVFVQYFYPVRWAMTTTFALMGVGIATFAILVADQGPAGQMVPLEMVLLVTYGLTLTCTSAGYSKEVFSRRNFRQILLLRDRQAKSEELAAEASNAAEAKARFLAMAAHELRTPLNAMIGFAELVRMTRDSSRPGTVMDERFSAIERDANHLYQLVESVLTVSKDGSESLSAKKQYFQIAPLLEHAAKDFSASTYPGSVQCDVPSEASMYIVIGDPAVYRTLVDCLIRHVRALNRNQTDIRLGFERMNQSAFLLSVYPEIRNSMTGDWGETITVPMPDAVDDNPHQAPSTGLLSLLAESQGTAFQSVELGNHMIAFGLQLPEALVAPLAEHVPHAPIEARQAC